MPERGAESEQKMEGRQSNESFHFLMEDIFVHSHVDENGSLTEESKAKPNQTKPTLPGDEGN